VLINLRKGSTDFCWSGGPTENKGETIVWPSRWKSGVPGDVYQGSRKAMRGREDVCKRIKAQVEMWGVAGRREGKGAGKNTRENPRHTNAISAEMLRGRGKEGGAKTQWSLPGLRLAKRDGG